jgi:hypothetical protein
MLKPLSFLLLFALVPLAFAQEKPKDKQDFSPSEVVKQWNQAASKRDMKTLAKLASGTAPKQSLELIDQQFFLHYQGETKIIHEEISGGRAIVVFRVENRGAVFTAEIRYGFILLVREDGQWKVTGEEGSGVLKPGRQPGDK